MLTCLAYFCQMRTTLDIDDSLLDALRAQLPDATKTEAIETAIAAFVGREALDQLRAIAGTIEIEDASPTLRSVDRTT